MQTTNNNIHYKIQINSTGISTTPNSQFQQVLTQRVHNTYSMLLESAARMQIEMRLFLFQSTGAPSLDFSSSILQQFNRLYTVKLCSVYMLWLA